MSAFMTFLEKNALVFAIFSFVFLVLSIVLFFLYRKKVKLVQEKDMQNQIALNEACIAASNANSAKSAFLANMSHDIRTPMNAIVGMVAIAGANLDNRERLKDCLKKINASLKHLLGIINNVLDMSKIESGKMELVTEKFDLEGLFKEIFDITKPLSDPKNLTLQFPNFSLIQHKIVIGDKQRLSQVFMNLLSNAFKYTSDGGRISVQIHEAPTGNKNANCYEFSFSDTGCGMTEEFMEKLFSPFTRNEDVLPVRKVQGTGLGLAISRNIVQMMGGNITVKSKVNEGSTFTVTLFLEAADKEDKTIKSPDTKNSSEGTEAQIQVDNDDDSFSVEEYKNLNFSGKRVLLVEDIDINAEIESEILKMTGLEVEHATNGQEAVFKIIANGDNYYDIVFMDIQMPVKNGYVATKEIRSYDSPYMQHLPIVAMTANTFADDVAKAKEVGMDEHISKPLQFDLLMAILERWLG